MGKVMNRIRIINNTDVGEARRGVIAEAAIRSLEVDALVDTGAISMVIPAEIVAQLGLSPEGNRKVRYADGRVDDIPWCADVRFEICGRQTVCDAYVTPAGTQVLIGQIPLEALDLIVDPKNREVRVNPASPDVPLLDLLAAG